MSRGLMDMPEDVMSKIMEDIGIKTILNVRKVCHELQNFIDDFKPDANFEEMKVSARYLDSISVFYSTPREIHEVAYKKHTEGCLVELINARNEVLLKNEDFIAASMNDLEIVLGHQKSVLKQFTIYGRYKENRTAILLENLQRILKVRVPPLKVEKFAVERMDQNQICSILPLLNLNTLETFVICGDEDGVEVDQLIELDHWRSVKNIVVDTPIDLKYIQYFTHFSTAVVYFKSDNFPNLVSLKNIFLQSSGFETIKIRLNNYDIKDVQQSMESPGGLFFEINLEENFIHEWYYRIPATNQILEITIIIKNFFENYIWIILSRKEESKLPRGLVIQN